MKFTEPMFRPPQESRSIILRGTQGCTYNKCAFCSLCRNSAFMMTNGAHVREQMSALPQNLLKKNPVFLAGANPFAMSFRRLEEIVQAIREYVPEVSVISMHTRIDDIERKSTAELNELCRMGVAHLYPGTESGNPRALAIMNKGATVQDADVQLGRLRDAGIAFTANYMLGMMGKGFAVESGILTAELFNRTHPARITTTGITVFGDTPLQTMRDQGVWVETSDREKLTELHAFIQNLNVETVVDTRHYLNLINMTIHMPDERNLALARIERFLREHDDEEIQRLYRRDTFTVL